MPNKNNNASWLGPTREELEAVRCRLEAESQRLQARLRELEAQKSDLLAAGAARAGQTQRQQVARQVSTVEAEAAGVERLHHLLHKQRMIVERLLAILDDAGRRAAMAHWKADWGTLVRAGAFDLAAMNEQEQQLDHLLAILEGEPALAGEEVDMAKAHREPIVPHAGIVAQVLDGATIELADGRVVRYLGLEVPALENVFGKADPFARESRDANRELVFRRGVRLEQDVSDVDEDGRLLRYVYVGETMVNEALIRQGWARYLSHYPDTRHDERFLAAEIEARKARRGIWADPRTL